MQLSVTGKQTEIGAALRRHIEGSLGSILDKYFKTAIEAHVIVSKEAHLSRAEISIRIGRGIVVNARAAASDAYLAFDAAAERLAKQLRRYKRRLRDHHAKGREPAGAGEQAMDYVLAPIEEEEAEGEEAETCNVNGAPAVIAEMSTELPSLTVGEAAMRMDLAEAPVLLFRNRSHGELNLVYRRTDGNIGWIDPKLDAARSTRRTASQAIRHE
ncbi:MAG TPA: ribosome-associated translation inhibitor RaiA [Stellaceae bacterium]|jgi:ribosomal subunit interface protein|nr:ribosome-associated translation inhibitor RaiA [Stellaceae bacterium]